MSKQQQMKDILKETIEYYAKDPDNRRGIDEDGNCHYTWGDTHCAIGRYVKEEYQRENWIENDMSVNELCQNTDDGEWKDIEHTEKQLLLKGQVSAMGW